MHGFNGLKSPINLGEAVVDLCEAFAQHAPAEEPVAGSDPKETEADRVRLKIIRTARASKRIKMYVNLSHAWFINEGAP